MNDKLKIVSKDYIPTYGTEYSAGIDLPVSNEEEIVIEPKKTVMVNTGIRVAIPEGYFGGVYPRSSTGVKRNLILANTIGVIDSDYRGEIMMYFYNYGDEAQIIKKGDRLAQLVIQPYQKFDIEIVDELDDTDRGESGFGSTGR